MVKTTRTCPECGEAFAASHPRKLFCSKAHGVAYNNRQLVRGQALVGLAQAWRAGRGRKSEADRNAARDAMVEFFRAVKRMTDEDLAAGRADPVRLYRARAARGLLD